MGVGGRGGGTYSVTLLDTPRLEDVGHPGDLSEELGIGDVDALSRLVGLVKDGGLHSEKGEKWSVQTPRVKSASAPKSSRQRLPPSSKGTNLIGVLEGPSVDAVVRSVQSSLGKPLDVARLEASRSDSLEVPVPVERLLGHL